MIKDHSDSEKGNLFFMCHPTDKKICGALAGMKNSSFSLSGQINLTAHHSTSSLPLSYKGNVLFNDALNTFYLRLYGVRHMIKYHSDSESRNLLPPLHGLVFPISSKGSFICIIPQRGQNIPQPLLHQSWSTGWNEK